VCDKVDHNPSNPYEDRTYYQTLTYHLLDGTNTSISFDSTRSDNPTGEVEVVEKIIPINETASMLYWINDTIETFRTCPSYTSASNEEEVVIIGRNFIDTGSNTCRVRVCNMSDVGPNNCLNRDGSLGRMTDLFMVVPAFVESGTRLTCMIPSLRPTPNLDIKYHTSFAQCHMGTPHSYTRRAEDGTVETLTDLFIKCTTAEISDGYCSHTPEYGMRMNPCYVVQAVVDVSNDGIHYSGDGLVYYHTALDPTQYTSHNDLIVSPTYAIYTYVIDQYYPTDPMMIEMDKNLCMRVMHAEEEARTRERGWFLLTAMQSALISIDLSHLPDDIIYNEHFTVGIFASPSRCNIQACGSTRNRLVPPEVLPCSMPMKLSSWFTDKSVKKNQMLNLTVLALDDMIFKVEIHLLHGLFYPFRDFFLNTTTVQSISPQRANSTLGAVSPGYRQLSPFVSFEERNVFMEYFFGAVYQYKDTSTVSSPLNLPPLYGDYERGRALSSFNTTRLNDMTPTIIQHYKDVAKGKYTPMQSLI